MFLLWSKKGSPFEDLWIDPARLILGITIILSNFFFGWRSLLRHSFQIKYFFPWWAICHYPPCLLSVIACKVWPPYSQTWAKCVTLILNFVVVGKHYDLLVNYILIYPYLISCIRDHAMHHHTCWQGDNDCLITQNTLLEKLKLILKKLFIAIMKFDIRNGQ